MTSDPIDPPHDAELWELNEAADMLEIRVEELEAALRLARVHLVAFGATEKHEAVIEIDQVLST